MLPARNDILEQRLDEVVTAYLEAVEAGSAVDRQEWLSRHPELAEGLAAFFTDTDRVRSWTEPLHQAVRDVRTHQAAGVRFGDYELLKEIGRGGNGVVYEARQLSLNRVLALKMVRIDQLGDETERQRLRNEAETVALLDHPRIVPVYEVGERDGQMYFSMKLVAAGSLAGQLQRFATQPRLAAGIVAQVARAVHHAHQRGVLHRDLKPSNILLDNDGGPHVADFGLAKRVANEPEASATGYATHSAAIVGTPSYMAPEQTVSDRRGVTTAADVYGLGGILYALLTGGPPFQDSDVIETIRQVREQAPVPPDRRNPRVGRDLATICLKCLEKDPHRRYSSAEALADDLERFLEGKPIVARPMPGWERAWKWTRRKPAAAALMGVSGLSALGLTAGVIIYNVQLQKAVDRASANEADARRQQQRAREHYRQARDSLEQMLQRFDGYRLGEVPQLKELQRRQLEDALAFYQGAFKEEDGHPDPEVRRDTAFACKRAADIQTVLGQHEAAGVNYGRAITLLEELPAEERDTPQTQLLLGGCYNNRGLLANSRRQWTEAERYHRKARDLHESLARARPDDFRARSGMAESEYFLGVVYQLAGRPDEAQRQYREVVKLYTALIRDQPGIDSYRSRLATTHNNQGVIYQYSQRREEAVRAYEAAERVLAPLIKRHPTAGEHKLAVAAVYSNWGDLLRKAGKAEQALPRLSQAVELSEAVLSSEPQHGEARSRAFNTHGARAQAYEALGRFADAVKDWDRVVELDDGPDRWIRRALRAVVLARAGEHVRAVAEVEVMEKDPKVSNEGVWELARACALSIGAARKDGKRVPAEQTALADRYGTQALGLLKKLHEQGYFKNADNARALASEKELGALRDRSDFQRLLKQVEGRKK
jgi:tetratricopeptide (TPR) repeat protein/tRNA A-37 threonylcarbamoyl transferase component Bud32